MERHRAGRALMGVLRDPKLFKVESAVQVGEVGVVAKGWFAEAKSIEVKEGKTTITEIKSGSVDWIISCHHLSKVHNYEADLLHMAKALSSKGSMYLCFPSPSTRAVTTALPGPGDLRIFGKDVEETLSGLPLGLHISAITVEDPVTSDTHLSYLLTKDFFWQRRVVQAGFATRLLQYTGRASLFPLA